MTDLVSRPFHPEMCCEVSVFGKGRHLFELYSRKEQDGWHVGSKCICGAVDFDVPSCCGRWHGVSAPCFNPNA